MCPAARHRRTALPAKPGPTLGCNRLGQLAHTPGGLRSRGLPGQARRSDLPRRMVEPFQGSFDTNGGRERRGDARPWGVSVAAILYGQYDGNLRAYAEPSADGRHSDRHQGVLLPQGQQVAHAPHLGKVSKPPTFRRIGQYALGTRYPYVRDTANTVHASLGPAANGTAAAYRQHRRRSGLTISWRPRRPIEGAWRDATDSRA